MLLVRRFDRCLKMLFFACIVMGAAPPPLVLSAPKPLAPMLDAFPRIVSPLTPKTMHMNALLAAADRRALVAVEDCREDAADDSNQPPKTSYERTVTVAMRGPVFLALTASDESDCGGPYPNAVVLALTYDLTTGAPVNWARYLPKSMIDSAATEDYDDDTTIGEITSAALLPLFFKSLGEGVDDANRCATALTGEGVAFMIWPDAPDGGLDIYDPDVPHVEQPCAGPVTVTLDQLRALGVGQRALDAIAGT